MEFDEDYFENQYRKNLFDYLSALYDDMSNYLKKGSQHCALRSFYQRMGEVAGGWLVC